MPYVTKPCTRCYAIGRVPCRSCSGGRVTCTGCQGSGRDISYLGNDMQCMRCNGSRTQACGLCGGSISGMECPTCRGSRVVREFEQDFSVPKPPAPQPSSAPRPPVQAKPLAPAKPVAANQPRTAPIPAPAPAPLPATQKEPGLLIPFLRWAVLFVVVVTVVVNFLLRGR